MLITANRIPNFILLAVPATLEPSSLNTMIAFATGGLLGDVFLHLVPHSFFGEGAEGHHHGRSVLVDEKRSIVIGCVRPSSRVTGLETEADWGRGAIFAGFAAFFVLDKTMRVLSAQTGDEGHSHGHSHSHSHSPVAAKSSAVEGTPDASGLRSRSKNEAAGSSTATDDKVAAPEVNPSLKLSAYLNLFGDFTHNITDGLAMAASFYSSPALGAVTTIATFCHEIPHEVSLLACPAKQSIG